MLLTHNGQVAGCGCSFGHKLAWLDSIAPHPGPEPEKVEERGSRSFGAFQESSLITRCPCCFCAWVGISILSEGADFGDMVQNLQGPSIPSDPQAVGHGKGAYEQK